MKKLITLAFILLLGFSNLYGFDGERKGFIFGGGIGVNLLSISRSNSNFSESKTAFLTNFKIGYAPSNTLEIFYISKVSWFSGSTDDLTLFLLGAVAATFYFNNTSETGWFASGGIGYSSIIGELSGSSSSSTEFGFGVFGGGGYEFAAHWSVEVDLLSSSIDSQNYFGVLVSINVLGF